MDQKIVREMAEKRAIKNNLVSSVDRSDKIRTYNYAQVLSISLCFASFVNYRVAIGKGNGSPNRSFNYEPLLCVGGRWAWRHCRCPSKELRRNYDGTNAIGLKLLVDVVHRFWILCTCLTIIYPSIPPQSPPIILLFRFAPE